ncbi:MAG: MurR/RpiR family transcriptional regulator [Sarcina sp.]
MFSADKISSLNELELNVYNYVIANKNSVIYMRIRDLANETHVSTTTILRFCKKFNCDGFSEFKIKLKMNLNTSDEVIIKDDKSALLEFFERATSDIFINDIKDIANLINENKNIFWIGFGNSGSLATYAARYLGNMGKFALAISDSFYPTEKILGEDSIAIILSVEGESPQIIECANRIKRNGGLVVSITNSKNCTLAKLSDKNISYYSPSRKNGHHQLTTQVPVIYIIEKIASELSIFMKQ